MALSVTKEQRDALYEQSLDRLSGIGDIEVALQAGNHDVAKRLAGEYSDELRLLVDLGFGDGDGEPVELTAPPELLCRVLPRMRSSAVSHAASLQQEWTDAREVEDRDRGVMDACDAVLRGLDTPEVSSR